MESRAGHRIVAFFRTIIYDNRGTGESDKPDVPYSRNVCGRRDFSDRFLKLDRVHVFGVSMGGMIAQELALRYSSRLQTLTLGCTTCGGKNAVPPPPESLKFLTAPRDGASDEELIRRSWPLAYTPEYIRDHRADSKRRFRACSSIRRRVHLQAPSRSDLWA